MNSLTLFLYLLDVLSNIKHFSETVVLGTAFVGAIAAMFGTMALSMETGWEDGVTYGGGTKIGVKTFLTKLVKYTIFNKILWVFIALTLFIPSKNTMYLMAGSEIGEEVIESELGQKVQDYVIDLIDDAMEGKPNG